MTARRLDVAVIGGGANTEHTVSLASAAGVAAALRRSGHHVATLTIGEDGSWLGDDGLPLDDGLATAVSMLRDADVVFPMVHGVHGEDGTLAALLDLCGVPYVGSGIGAGAVGMDKRLTKLVAEQAGVAVAAGGLVDASGTLVATAGGGRRGRWFQREQPAPRGVADLRFPVVVKPTTGGSSVGVSVATSIGDLPAAVATAAATGATVMVEEFVDGREIDIAVLELANGSLLVSPPLEIAVAQTHIFDTTTKYDGSAPFIVPAQLPPAVVDDLDVAARAVYRALGCRGVARVDFFVTEDGLVLNEINTMPGMTEQSQVPRMFQAAGIEYGQLLELLIDAALPARGCQPPPESTSHVLPSSELTAAGCLR